MRTDERFIRCIYVIDDYHVTRKGRNASENETCRLSHKMLAPRLQSWLPNGHAQILEEVTAERLIVPVIATNTSTTDCWIDRLNRSEKEEEYSGDENYRKGDFISSFHTSCRMEALWIKVIHFFTPRTVPFPLILFPDLSTVSLLVVRGERFPVFVVKQNTTKEKSLPKSQFLQESEWGYVCSIFG